MKAENTEAVEPAWVLKALLLPIQPTIPNSLKSPPTALKWLLYTKQLAAGGLSDDLLSPTMIIITLSYTFTFEVFPHVSILSDFQTNDSQLTVYRKIYM